MIIYWASVMLSCHSTSAKSKRPSSPLFPAACRVFVAMAMLLSFDGSESIEPSKTLRCCEKLLQMQNLALKTLQGPSLEHHIDHRINMNQWWIYFMNFWRFTTLKPSKLQHVPCRCKGRSTPRTFAKSLAETWRHNGSFQASNSPA